MPTTSPAPRSLWLASAVFALGTATWSWWRWWTFQYGTFDLAFYVQALWLALHGEWHVSLLDVPLLGNHAEPIVFLFVPLFAVCPHPMLLVLMQALAIATAPFTAWRIARHLQLQPGAAWPLAMATLLTPATGFIALHEFHPEAFALPLLLLLAEARLSGHLRRMWLWWVLLLACKENLALLLVAWAGVFALLDCRRPWSWQWRWNVLPFAAAATWLVIYTRLVSPALNGGAVDYLELYSHLGRSGGEIVRGFLVNPMRPLMAIGRAATEGDLIWGLFVPMLGLPLFRPRWILIGLAVLLPHLLSWRASEWSLRFHYAAPLVPLLWLATAEAVARLPRSATAAWLVFAACAVMQLIQGPLQDVPAELATVSEMDWQRTWKAREIAAIEADSKLSVTASQPYLSHLAQRKELHSLHHILKGLKTLSRQRYVPRPTDRVIIDYGDASTFSVESGFYHPKMRTANGDIVPSSDELLHAFLASSAWQIQSTNELSVLRAMPNPETPQAPALVKTPASEELTDLQVTLDPSGSALHMSWLLNLPGKARRFDWMQLVLPQSRKVITRGLLGSAAPNGVIQEQWQVLLNGRDHSTSDGFLLLYDHAQAAWTRKLPPSSRDYVLSAHQLSARKEPPR